MDEDWWFAEGNGKIGPLPLTEFLSHLSAGRINLETSVWSPGWKAWRPLKDVEEIRPQILEVLHEQQRRTPPPLPNTQNLPQSAVPPSFPPAKDSISGIWNPNAAANWSLIFTPAFGSYFQMLNWRTLGESEKAASAQTWFYVSLGILAVYVLMAIFMSDAKASDAAARGLGFLYLLVWYFGVGRSQGKYVKARYGSSYPKKPWGKPLLIGIAAVIGIAYFIAAVIVGAIVGVAERT